jgi:hypothetical protein
VGLRSIRRVSISDLNANVKMLAFTDGTCVYIMLLPLGFIFAEFIAKRIHVWVIIKIHALFPVHILVTSNIFVPFCISLLVFPTLQ